jgi:hypothetical protein
MKKAFIVGGLAFLLIALITLLTPIGLYDGEALYVNGEIEPVKLSLNYLIHKQEYISSITDLEDIRLNGIGWLMFIIINFGLPFLIGYRFYLHEKQKKSERV